MKYTIVLWLILAGCSVHPGPPSRVEQLLFVITTNTVEEVVNVTNMVAVTVTNSVTVTNIVDQLRHVAFTNWVTNIVVRTNLITEYNYLPGSGERAATGAGTAAANLYAPGVGGVLAGSALTLVFARWRALRSGKTTKRKQ